MAIDYGLYPELKEGELPEQLDTLEERADYIHRFCATWDFYGFGPTEEFLELLPEWREALLLFPILQSPAYCALCDLTVVPHGPPEPFLGRLRWEEQDELEGREPDPCLDRV